MNKLAITISCGIGDAHTYSARLPALCYKEYADKVDFYIKGGYKHIPHMVSDLLLLSPYVRNVYIDVDSKQTGERYKFFLDWRPDDNPLECPIQYPYHTPYKKEDLEEVSSYLEDKPNPVILQPYTVGGNARGLSEKYIRSPDEAWWVNLINRLKALGITPIIVGSEEDAVDWNMWGVEVTTFYGKFLKTIPLILKSRGFVGTNSWCWQVAYYSGLKTVCMYFYPQHHLRLHLAKQKDNLTVFYETPSVDRTLDKLNLKELDNVVH